MSQRADILLAAIETLEARNSVELIGDIGSGRSYILERVRSHFTMLDWKVVSLRGMHALREQPLAALRLAGFREDGESHEGSLLDATRWLTTEIEGADSVIIIDDSDLIDDLTWAVINSVSMELGTPLFHTLPTHEQWGSSLKMSEGNRATISLQLPGMSYGELRLVLEQCAENPLDEALMSRVYALSGGVVGIARAILEAGKRAGRIRVVEGTLRTDGRLWVPQLRAIARRILRPLSPEQIDALRTLALVGTCSLQTASTLLPLRTIQHLEELSFVGIVTTADGHMVAVRPTLLEEYFRDAALPGERAQLMETIDPSSNHAASLGAESAPRHPDPTLVVTLAHEATQRMISTRRELWAKHRGFKEATGLLEALVLEPSYDASEIDRLIEEADALDREMPDRAQWVVAHARYHAHYLGNINQARQLLLEQVDACAEIQYGVLAAQTELEFTLGAMPEEEPFVDLSLETLDEHARAQVVFVRVLWNLVTGRVVPAKKLLQAHKDLVSNDFRFAAEEVSALFSNGQLRLAEEEVEQRLAVALSRSSAREIRAFAYLGAFSAFLAKRYSKVKRMLALANALGLHAGATPLTDHGVDVLSRIFSTLTPSETLSHQVKHSQKTEPVIEGILPGQQSALLEARLAFAGGKPSEALKIAFAEGDRLWALGRRLAAAFMYFEGLHSDPDHESWLRIQSRIEQIESPGIELWNQYLGALSQGDEATLMEYVREAQALDANVSPAGLAEEILRAATASQYSQEFIETLQEISRRGGGVRPRIPAVLSARELEVAELVSAGVPNPKIAERLFISRRTVESHVMRLNKKTGATKRSELRSYLISTGQWAIQPVKK